MIFDKISNLYLYKGMHPNLDIIIDYIANHSLSKLNDGKTIINDDI